MPKGSSGPLSGIKVVELAHVMAGPTCGLMLADLGADVVKVEKVPGGDDSRHESVSPDDGGQTPPFEIMNRNKRSIALDLKTDDGKEVLHRLLGGADVLIENYRMGTMKRLGFGYAALRERYRRLVYCAISGFGRTGPYADRGGFDLIAQGMSGIMSITGEGPDHPPVKCGAPVTDITAGILGAMGVVAALYERERTGEGQMIDTSLLEAGTIFTYWHSALTFAYGEAPGALGSAHPLSAPYRAFETADGWITIGAANQPNWLRLLGALGLEDLADDPRFVDNAARMANRAVLEDILASTFRQGTTAAWLERLEEVGVPAGPILSVGEMHADPQIRSRRMVVDLPDGKGKALGCPVKFSNSASGVRLSAPRLGEQTVEILSEQDYTERQICDLIDSGIVLAAGGERES